MTGSSEPPRPGSKFGTILPIALGTLLWLLLWLQILAIAPGLKRYYDEFGMALPSSTRAVLGVSGWAQTYWWIVFPMILGLAVGYSGLLAYLRSRPSWARAATALAWLAIAALTAIDLIVFGSLVLPYVKLTEGLAK